MRKFSIIIIFLLCVMTGCGKSNKTEIPPEQKKTVEALKNIDPDAIGMLNIDYYDDDGKEKNYMVDLFNNIIRKDHKHYSVDDEIIIDFSKYIAKFNVNLFSNVYCPHISENPDSKIFISYFVAIVDDKNEYKLEICEKCGWPDELKELIREIEDCLER